MQQMAIAPEEIPEDIRHCKSDMLIMGFRKGLIILFDPLFSGHFSTRATKSGFTGMRDFDGVMAMGAAVLFIATNFIFTAQHFYDSFNTVNSDKREVSKKEKPPVELISKEMALKYNQMAVNSVFVIETR